MAAASLPAPGTEFGPCSDECDHTDCAASRTQAATICVHCPEPIGYDRRFFNVTPDGEPPWSKLAHEACELEVSA